MRFELIPKRMSTRHRLMVFLVSVVSFLAMNLTESLVVESLLYGFMLIASTGTIVTSYLFIFSSSYLYFRSYCKACSGSGYRDSWASLCWDFRGGHKSQTSSSSEP